MIRVATENDAGDLLKIYAYYVENTAISFEYEVPSEKEFKKRIRNTLRRYPYLVMEQDDEIVGYTYAGAFKPRNAYDWAVETTIYIARDKRKMGFGKKLYRALEEALVLQNVINLNACIGYPIVEDEYLTKNSMQYHKHLGYQFVGEFHQCGYKFGRWYNMVWMEKSISSHPEHPLPFKPFREIYDERRDFDMKNEKAYIAPGAYVGGDVTLGENVSIWYNAVVRGDCSSICIGNNSNVQDNCTIHTDPGYAVMIGEGVTIGHNAIVHGCTVGDNTVIGMGSIILNGAKIRKNCIIGAGALVTGGTVIPDYSMVFGSPAKVVRSLTDDEVEANQQNAKHYVKLMNAQL